MFVSLIGFDVYRSFTPRIYDFLFKKTKKNLFYRGFSIKKCSKLYKLIILIFSKKCVLLNITIPFKELLFFLPNFVCKNSNFYNSINCIYIFKNCFVGFNTDGIGFIKDFNNRLFFKKPTNILVLGAGGAFKGIIKYIKKINYKNIYLKNRNSNKLISFLDKKKNIKKYFDNKFDLIINTIPTQFLLNFLNINKFNIKKCICYDISYFVSTKKIKKVFNIFFNGHGMLLKQALENFKILIIFNARHI